MRTRALAVAVVIGAAGCGTAEPALHRVPLRPQAVTVDPFDERRGVALFDATAAYLASPMASADAYLVAFATAHRIADYVDRPGGCDAWFAAAQRGGRTTLVGAPEGTPPGGGAFAGLRPNLALVRVEIGLLAVRCATDPYAGRLPKDLAALADSWAQLEAYAVTEGLAVPTAMPSPPVLPPGPVTYRGTGDATIVVTKPVRDPLDPVLVTGEGRDLAITALAAGLETLQYLPSGTGTHLLDAGAGTQTAILHVAAEGPWSVTLRSLGLVRRGMLPGAITGTGADVVLADLSLLGAAREAVLEGDAELWVHADATRRRFAGAMPAGALAVLEVQATGPWSLHTP